MIYIIPLIAIGCGCYLWKEWDKKVVLILSFLFTATLFYKSKFQFAGITFTAPGEAIHKVFQGRLSTLPIALKPSTFFALITVITLCIAILATQFNREQTLRKIIVFYLLFGD